MNQGSGGMCDGNADDVRSVNRHRSGRPRSPSASLERASTSKRKRVSGGGVHLREREAFAKSTIGRWYERWGTVVTRSCVKASMD